MGGRDGIRGEGWRTKYNKGKHRKEAAQDLRLFAGSSFGQGRSQVLTVKGEAREAVERYHLSSPPYCHVLVKFLPLSYQGIYCYIVCIGHLPYSIAMSAFTPSSRRLDAH
jgi:hypothetical protein